MEYLWHIYGLWEYPGFMMVEFGISDFWRYEFEKNDLRVKLDAFQVWVSF